MDTSNARIDKAVVSSTVTEKSLSDMSNGTMTLRMDTGREVRSRHKSTEARQTRRVNEDTVQFPNVSLYIDL